MSFDADKKAAELIGVMGMVDQVCASDIAWLVAWVKGIHAAGLEAGRKEIMEDITKDHIDPFGHVDYDSDDKWECVLVRKIKSRLQEK